jgi:glycosyltransferase involved in cell wall biosynthesis
VKVIHLNTYAGNGGAGIACMRLNKALQDQGFDSELAVNFLFKKNPEVHDLSNRMGIISKWYSALGIILERFIGKVYIGSIPIPFSIPVWGKDLTRRQVIKSADIIHLHWVNHAFLGPSHLARLAQFNKPIVWTFHDSNPFTGGCHVRYSCTNYQGECGNCPVLKDPAPDDMSRSVWKQKEKYYRHIRFNIIAPSKWMAESVAKSRLLGSSPVINIPNAIDTEVFKPYSKAEARRVLGLPEDKFIMMSGFMPSRRDKHKGTPYLIESLAIFMKDYGVKEDEAQMVIFGTRDSRRLPKLPVPTRFLGTIANEEKLALCYSAADVFLVPSLEDNLPNTVMESMACGTPVVAFTTGGIPDMIVHKSNGYLAGYRSSADLAAGINWVRNADREILSANARQYVLDHFSAKVIADRHIEFYRSLIADHV